MTLGAVWAVCSQLEFPAHPKENNQAYCIRSIKIDPENGKETLSFQHSQVSNDINTNKHLPISVIGKCFDTKYFNHWSCHADGGKSGPHDILSIILIHVAVAPYRCFSFGNPTLNVIRLNTKTMLICIPKAPSDVYSRVHPGS